MFVVSVRRKHVVCVKGNEQALADLIEWGICSKF